MSASAGWGLYQTPNNTGEADFYRPRSYGLTDLASALNSYDWRELVEFSRQMVAQMPDLGYAVQQKNMYAVGDAWHPIYAGRNAAWGEAAQDWLQHVWMPQASLAGGFFDWNRDLLVSAMSWDVDGDDCAIFVVDESEFPKLAYRSADQIGNGTTGNGDEVKGGPFDGAKISNGIIRDRLGRRIGVRIVNPSRYGSEPTQFDLEAQHCDLEAEPVWRVQDRGLPRPASALMHMMDVQDILVFLKRGIKLASAIGLVHYNEAGEADAGSDIIDARTTNTTAPAQDIKIEKRFGGEVMYMRANLGEKVEEVLSKRPSPENMEFLRELKRNGMLSLGWFLELLDPERVGGAPMRAIQDQARHSVLDRQKTIHRRAKRSVLFALAQAMKTKRIPQNPDPYDWMHWGFGLPALITVDPGYDQQADRENLIIGTTTKAAVCQKAGRRYQEVDAQRLKENQELLDNALTLMSHANPKIGEGEQPLTLREAIALMQGSSNAPENLRADMTGANQTDPNAQEAPVKKDKRK